MNLPVNYQSSGRHSGLIRMQRQHFKDQVLEPGRALYLKGHLVGYLVSMNDNWVELTQAGDVAGTPPTAVEDKPSAAPPAPAPQPPAAVFKPRQRAFEPYRE